MSAGLPRPQLKDASPALKRSTSAANTPLRRKDLLLAGGATSATRASSSPPTSGALNSSSSGQTGQSARKSLDQQLEELEFFNIAVSDCEDSPQRCRAELSSPSSTFKHDGQCANHDSAVKNLNISLRVEEDATASSEDKHLPMDAWSIEDWCSTQNFSPVSSGSRTSPCNAAKELAASQRPIADAVLAELQVDLESAMQKAVSQMNSWISEEIVAVRQKLQEDCQQSLKKAADSHAAEMRSEFERLEDVLLPRASRSSKSSEESRGLEDADALELTSAHVMEARMFADERRWRIGLDGIENTLSKHLESIDMLGKQLTMFSNKFATYDVELRENSQSILKLDAQLRVAGEKDRLDSRARFETQREMIESVRRQCTAAEARCFESMEARFSAVETERLSSSAELQSYYEIVDSLKRRTGQLAEQIETRTSSGRKIDQTQPEIADLREADVHVEQLELRLTAVEAMQVETAEKVSTLEEQVDSQMSSNASRQKAIERLEKSTSSCETITLEHEKRAHVLSEQISQLAGTIKGISESMERLDQKLHEADATPQDGANADEQIQELSGAMQAQIFALEQMQAQILDCERGLGELKEEVTTQLGRSVDSAFFSSVMGTVNDVTRRLQRTALSLQQENQRLSADFQKFAEDLTASASRQEVEMFRLELKEWVEHACATQKTTVSGLHKMFEQVRSTSEAQNGILKKHEQRIQVVSDAVF